MSKLRKKLVQELLNKPGVIEVKFPERDDGFTAIQVYGKDFAHFHHDNEIDIRLTKAFIAEQSLIHPAGSVVHPKRSENSPWIEMRFSNEEDVMEIVRLVSKYFEI